MRTRKDIKREASNLPVTNAATSRAAFLSVSQHCHIAVEETGAVPPGNAPGANQGWVRKGARVKPEIKLTPGKGLEDLTCSIEDLLDGVVKSNKVQQPGMQALALCIVDDWTCGWPACCGQWHCNLSG